MKHLIGKVTRMSPGTARVEVSRRWTHPLYKKSMLRTKSYLCQVSEADAVAVGDSVEIIQCKPVSKRKHFAIVRKAS